jgi:predicted N-acetyltransferase YhbS
MEIRRAVAEEARRLTRLARLAKASWGYPEAWLAEWASELTISPEYIRENAVYVAEVDGSVAGVVGVGLGEEGPEIAHLWVAPEAQGLGLGRALVRQARRVAITMQWPALRIVSDPYAQPFYERLGAGKVGDVDAPVAGTERTLPVLELEP